MEGHETKHGCKPYAAWLIASNGQVIQVEHIARIEPRRDGVYLQVGPQVEALFELTPCDNEAESRKVALSIPAEIEKTLKTGSNVISIDALLWRLRNPQGAAK